VLNTAILRVYHYQNSDLKTVGVISRPSNLASSPAAACRERVLRHDGSMGQAIIRAQPTDH
jgi:hypothetical protein